MPELYLAKKTFEVQKRFVQQAQMVALHDWWSSNPSPANAASVPG